MNIKILKWFIYISGILATYAFISVRYQPMFNFVIREKLIPDYWENTDYGELYYFNYIRNFREKNLPPYAQKYRKTAKHPSLNKADIITFGDSFFDFTRMTTFPEQLGDTLNLKVYYERYDYPLISLYEKKYKSTRSKILIYESAERYIPTRFLAPHKIVPYKDPRNKIRKMFANIRDIIFLADREAKFTMLLNRSYLSTDIHSFINTFKFNTFGYITSLTPKYCDTCDIPWLFYQEEVNSEPTSFYYHHGEGEIDTICDNIAELSKNLKELYNLDMVFMPIPSKYTIYHKLINQDKYNGFLPRLYAGLEKRGIPAIEFYEDYVNSDEILYYGTDTHWNEKGLKIALKKTVEVLEKYNPNELFAEDSNIDHKKDTVIN